MCRWLLQLPRVGICICSIPDVVDVYFILTPGAQHSYLADKFPDTTNLSSVRSNIQCV